MSENVPALETTDLRVSYGAHVALDGLNVSMQAGELVGIIGPNGAGKTSFIKALCGNVDHVGVIKVAGTELRRGADRRRHIGLVPQEIGLYPHLTARENLSVIASLLGAPSTDRKTLINDALLAVGMQAHENKRISDLSGGMKRRINVAAAIMHNPSVLIFDEPTAGVDIPARDAVHRLAHELSRGGMAVLLVTHELEQAEALCDKILLLSDGKRLGFDAPATLLERRFAGNREVVIRYSAPPKAAQLDAMRPFHFEPGELPTIWRAMTQSSEVSFVSAFMTALKGGDELLREISVRRPGLTALMHQVEINNAGNST